LRRLWHGAAPRPPAARTTPWSDKIFPFAGGKRKDLTLGLLLGLLLFKVENEFTTRLGLWLRFWQGGAY